MWNRQELKQQAKQIMKRSYWKMFLVSLVATILMGILSRVDNHGGFHFTQNIQTYNDGFYNVNEVTHEGVSFVSGILGGIFPFNIAMNLSIISIISIIVVIASILYNIFISNPIECGECHFYIENTDHEDTDFMTLFSAFKQGYMNIAKILVIRDIKIFLWSLLFVIPGVIKSYQYRMLPYILAENPDITTQDAFDRSKQLTDGQKLDIFVLDLSFIGWYFLGSILFGIGLYFVYPYFKSTNALLYLYLSDQYRENSYYRY
ncbi:DUF975 family protein [Absiella sp. AM29-15]|uniref:DUF975 family protein n=1 Tax=Absiella sp. AM29-15 TaxID=2292278 RepID=UPI000E40DC80|nr:DUF975 family protein [Absiella sp. AM29-15]RGC46365.1 DUF975 family protein [Absiella sp. AM29-15]